MGERRTTRSPPVQFLNLFQLRRLLRKEERNLRKERGRRMMIRNKKRQKIRKEITRIEMALPPPRILNSKQNEINS